MGDAAKSKRPKSVEKGKPRGKPFVPGDPRAGRPKGVGNKASLEVKDAARALVEDPAYRQNLAVRLNRGEAAPAVESMLWHYAYGKPKEMVELTGPGGRPLNGPQVMLYMPDNGRAIAAPEESHDAPSPPVRGEGDPT